MSGVIHFLDIVTSLFPAVSRTNPLPVEVTTTTASDTTYTDMSIAATGANQTIAANLNRKALEIINPLYNTNDITLNPVGVAAVVGASPSFVLRPGDSYNPVPPPTNEINFIATAGTAVLIYEGT